MNSIQGLIRRSHTVLSYASSPAIDVGDFALQGFADYLWVVSDTSVKLERNPSSIFIVR